MEKPGMTSDELIASVDAYFEVHLDSAYWVGLTSDVRSAAVTMALSDILAELPWMTLDDILSGSYPAKAIAEQAVFLARNYESLIENKVVSSEGIDGISTSYSLIGNNPGMSYRASMYVKKARRSIPARIQRG